MNLIKPGSWIDFHGIRAFVSAVLIESEGHTSYRLKWFDGPVVHSAEIESKMLIPEEPNTIQIGFTTPDQSQGDT